MKIVHVSTMDNGGAANAAYRLHAALLQAGVDSKFLVLHQTRKASDVLQFKIDPSSPSFLLRKLIRKISDWQFRQNRKELSKEIEIFSSPRTIYNICSHSVVQQADIIHLHWVANFVDIPSFFRTCRKPVVWTFHDENPFNGGVHYEQDIEKLSPKMLKWEKRFIDVKLASMQISQPVRAICPSQWMHSQLLRSRFKDVYAFAEHIPYGIDTTQFAVLSRDQARADLGLPSERKLILLICSDLRVFRKGFDLFKEVIARFSENDNVEFVLAGEASSAISLPFVRHVGFVSELDKLVSLYNAVDATLLTSREDNLPNVMIESLACGTPVLGFSIGGLQDVVIDGVNGWLAEGVSVESLYRLIKKFLTSPSLDREDIRKQAVNKFDNLTQVNRVTKLYQMCIQQPGL